MKRWSSFGLFCHKGFKGFSAKFLVGVCCPSKMIGLARPNSTSKVPAISTQKLPNGHSLDQNTKILGLSTRITKLLHFFEKSCPMAYPCLAQTKTAKKYTLGLISSTKKDALAGGPSPGTFTMEEPSSGFYNTLPINRRGLNFQAVKGSGHQKVF